MSKLLINEEELISAQSKYEYYAEQMSKLKKNLEDAVNGIREGWKSEAGDVFFDKFDVSFLSNLEDYTEVIRHMGNNVMDAENLYRQLFDEAEHLKLY